MSMTNRKTIEYLNASLSRNVPAIELVSSIAEFPYPMIFDWNGTAASDNGPIMINPETITSIEYVLSHGLTPFILTLASDWVGIQKLLKSQSRNITKQVVIMANKSWAPYHPYPPWCKQVRHLFPGTHLLPIIDNDIAAVRDNPGMRGYFVKTFRPLSETLDKDIKYDYPSLLHATLAAVDEYDR